MAKLLLASSLTMPVVGYSDVGPVPQLSDHGKVVALDAAKDALARCVAHDVAENKTMSYSDAITDSAQHGCSRFMLVAAGVIEQQFTPKDKKEAAYDLLFDELPIMVLEYLKAPSKEHPGL